LNIERYRILLECDDVEARKMTVFSLSAEEQVKSCVPSAWDGAGCVGKQSRSVTMVPQQKPESRWTRQANIERYGKLLHSHLSDIERQFVEKRLAEEKQAERPVYQRYAAGE
jgi:hypothetical protein